MREIWAERGGQRVWRKDLEQGRFLYFIADFTEPDLDAERIAHPEVVIESSPDTGEVVLFVSLLVKTQADMEVTPLLADFLTKKLGFAIRFSEPGFVARTSKDGVTRVVETDARQGRV